VSPQAWVAPSAVLVGEVSVEAGAAVLDGAVLTAESAPVHLGEQSIVMENAVLRGAGKHPTTVGRQTIIGPGAHVTGARIGANCMIATHSSVFNGAVIADGVLVAIGAIVHVGTRLEAGARVPMQHIAVGDPATVYPPTEAPAAHDAVEQIGFTKQVFDKDTAGLTFRQTIAWICETYASSLCRNNSRG
jgi:carbonic anhydrase/acetyltransferase-like protein (isoleucine patch superfamily)